MGICDIYVCAWFEPVETDTHALSQPSITCAAVCRSRRVYTLVATVYYIGSTAMPPMPPPAAVPAPGTRKLLSNISSSGSLFAAVAELDREAVKRELPNDVDKLKDLVLQLQALSCFLGL